MRKSALVIAAVVFAACSRTETESHGEVVDTLNTPNLPADLRAPGDSVSLATPDSLLDSIAYRRSTGTGRKPVEMKKQ